MHPIETFKRHMCSRTGVKILRTGAKVWPGSVNIDPSPHVPHAQWVGTDIEAGEGVDLVLDLQRLHEEHTGEFDAIYSVATLEHIERPWVAMYAMGQALKPGGILYLHTHQTFPIHGYPNDYFRFSDSALRTMCYDSQLEVLESAYDGPCTIVPPESVEVWNQLAESYLNICVCAQRKM